MTSILRLRSTHTPGFYNFNGSNLSKWFIAQAAVAAGTRNATILCLGDSTTAGQGATHNGPSNNAKSQSYPTQLASLLSNASSSSVIASNNVYAAGGSSPTYDSRITFATGWTGAVGTLGGGLVKSPTTPAIFGFTPANSVDTFAISYATNAGLGTFAVNVDGGATLATINTNTGTSGQGSVTVNPALGTHTLNIAWASGSNCYISEIRAYNSSVKEISVLNAGSCTSLVAGVASNTTGYDSLPRIISVAADLTIMMFGINDWNIGTSLSSFFSSLQTLVNTALVSGNAILMSGIPSSPGAALVTQAAFSSRMHQFARDNNIPFIDVFNLFCGSYSISNSRGWRYDTLHANGTGYGKIAGWVSQALKAPFLSK